jgi:hypothetical protein
MFKYLSYSFSATQRWIFKIPPECVLCPNIALCASLQQSVEWHGCFAADYHPKATNGQQHVQQEVKNAFFHHLQAFIRA